MARVCQWCRTAVRRRVAARSEPVRSRKCVGRKARSSRTIRRAHRSWVIVPGSGRIGRRLRETDQDPVGMAFAVRRGVEADDQVRPAGHPVVEEALAVVHPVVGLGQSGGAEPPGLAERPRAARRRSVASSIGPRRIGSSYRPKPAAPPAESSGIRPASDPITSVSRRPFHPADPPDDLPPPGTPCRPRVRCLLSPALAGDWPAWRFDARRSAATPDDLPAVLHPQWTLALPALKPAWPDQPLMPFDAAYEPVVAGPPDVRRLLPDRQRDRLRHPDRRAALAVPGRRPGPVRPARSTPASSTSSPTTATCTASTPRPGPLRWKFRGGPSDRKILGNGRLISTWPARGGPGRRRRDGLLRRQHLAVHGRLHPRPRRARPGEVVWTNDGDGSMYIKQPHDADSFAGVAPQGPLAVAGDRLLVPGGRSVPAATTARPASCCTSCSPRTRRRAAGTRRPSPATCSSTARRVLTRTGKYLGDASPADRHRRRHRLHLRRRTRSGPLGREAGAEIKPPKWKVTTAGAVKLPGGERHDPGRQPAVSSATKGKVAPSRCRCRPTRRRRRRVRLGVRRRRERR